MIIGKVGRYNIEFIIQKVTVFDSDIHTYLENKSWFGKYNYFGYRVLCWTAKYRVNDFFFLEQVVVSTHTASTQFLGLKIYLVKITK